MSYRQKILPFATMLLTTPGSSLYAQTTEDRDSGGLSDIVVTAQKREERLQDVPIAVAVVDAETLSKRGAMTTKDLELITPSLVTSEMAGFSQTYLRGIGSNVNAPTAEAGVANYEDGVYTPLHSATMAGLLGVERIEILYGPQGTLYGRNAVGGLINVITLTPSQQLEIAMKATVGNYERRELSGHVSGGISENLAVGLYGAATFRDTFLSFSPTRAPGTPKAERNYGLRGKFVATPTETLKITGLAEWRRYRGVEGDVFRQDQLNAVGFVTYGAPVLVKPYVIQSDVAQFAHVEVLRGSIQIDKEMGWADLVSISSYQTAKVDARNDIDATSASYLAGGSTNNNIENWSQELRFQSAAGSSVQWVAGLYYYGDKTGYFPTTTYFGDVLPSRNTVAARAAGVNTTSLAAFGQVTIPIADALKITIGGRYTRDKKRFVKRSTYTLDNPTGTIDGDPNDLTPSNVVTFPNVSKTWSKFTPKVTIDYRLGDVLLYATYSKGFKSGAFLFAAPNNPDPVNPEILTSFEGGIKSELFGRRLRLNISAFHYTYKDLQVNRVITQGDIQTSVTTNAAGAKIYGGELSATALLFDGFTASANIGYAHSRYTDFPSFAAALPAAAGNVTVDLNATGNPVDRTPKWTTSLSASYERTFDDDSGIAANITWSYNDGFAWDASNLYREPSYNVVNTSLGYTLPGGRFSLTGWITNLTDTHYLKGKIIIGPGMVAIDAPPRMYGLTIAYAL